MWIRRVCTIGICLALLASAAEVPRRSPEVAINLPGGKQLLLSQYRGKAVILAFILTYCSHCQKTTQILSQLQSEYGPRGLQVLGSAIEDGAAMAVPGFIRQFQPSFPVGFNTRDTVLEYLQHSPMMQLMMPQLVFIDRQGVIRGQHAGDESKFFDDQEKNIRAMIETMLKEDATQKRSGASKSRKKSS